jgi:hypothetical protein
MTTEPEPTTLSRDDLETLYLTRLMSRDAKVWADRVEAGDRLTTRPPMQAGAVAIRRLAQATRCPKGVPPFLWLQQTGWLERVDGGYVFTKKLCLPRGAKKAKHRNRAAASGAEEHREAERAMS